VDLDGDDEVEDICYCTGRLLEDYSVHVTLHLFVSRSLKQQ
jgi:hypothetical protein